MPSRTPARTLPRRPSRTKRRLLAVTSLGLAGLLAGLLSGCASANMPGTPLATNSYAQVSGNWQFNSSSPPASRLSSLGGSLSVNGSAVTGTLHALAASGQCLQASAAVPVTGSIDASGRLTLSAPLSGGTLAIAGTLADDRRSLLTPTYTVIGGSCAFPAASPVSARDTPVVTAQQFQPVTGTYTGTLTTTDGETFALSSTLTQTSQPDADGVYHVTGSASSPGNACVPASLPATASTLDGGSLSTTYTDATTGTSITGTATTSADASTLTVSSWTINSTCGSGTGSGLLTRQ